MFIRGVPNVLFLVDLFIDEIKLSAEILVPRVLPFINKPFSSS